MTLPVRPERYSYEMIKSTKEFVVNLTTKDLVRACDYCGVTSGRDVDKFEKMKLTPIKLPNVSVPGIKESKYRMQGKKDRRTWKPYNVYSGCCRSDSR